MAEDLRLLCTPPIAQNWASELAAIPASVTTLQFDGTFDAADDATWDGAMITPESFKLYFESGAKALAELYDVLAGLVRAGRVAWVHMCASGLDVPLFFPLMKACHEANVTITHCPGVYAVPIAQYCLGHILSICRMGPAHAANQASRSYTSLLQRDARTCTVGVVGAGGIGTEVARLSKAFGMRVLGWRRQAAPALNFDEVLSGDDGLAAVLSTSDFVVVAVPKTAATTGLLNAERLGMMKPSAWLINVARGAVVDETALISALGSAGVAGAVLDVFATEPLPPDSALWAMENVIITPHDSWRTDEALKDNHRCGLALIATDCH